MIEKQKDINGICDLTIIDKQSILIKSPEWELLTLTKGENSGLKELTICIGETFNLSDADHISDTYKLIKIYEGHVIFEVEFTFTGVGIPEDDWTERKMISIKPYISQ